MICGLFSAIAFTFWKVDLQYALPTEKPINYTEVELQSVLDLNNDLVTSDKPTYFHFFQPSCPCSRFNLKHYQSLHRNYSDKITFFLVIPEKADFEWTNDLVDVEVTVIKDNDSRLAKKCGVYSTPQAVLIDNNQSLCYRGNYNKGRFCTSKNSNYAEIAIEALLQNRALPPMNILATKAYGCEYNK